MYTHRNRVLQCFAVKEYITLQPSLSIPHLNKSRCCEEAPSKKCVRHNSTVIWPPVLNVRFFLSLAEKIMCPPYTYSTQLVLQSWQPGPCSLSVLLPSRPIQWIHHAKMKKIRWKVDPLGQNGLWMLCNNKVSRTHILPSQACSTGRFLLCVCQACFSNTPAWIRRCFHPLNAGSDPLSLYHVGHRAPPATHHPSEEFGLSVIMQY